MNMHIFDKDTFWKFLNKHIFFYKILIRYLNNELKEKMFMGWIGDPGHANFANIGVGLGGLESKKIFLYVQCLFFIHKVILH